MIAASVGLQTERGVYTVNFLNRSGPGARVSRVVVERFLEPSASSAYLLYP